MNATFTSYVKFNLEFFTLRYAKLTKIYLSEKDKE